MSPAIARVAGPRAAVRTDARLTPVVTDDGGTDLVLYRKDRFVQTTGAGLLSEHRLKPDSADPADGRDMLQHPVLLDFTKGHWVTSIEPAWLREFPRCRCAS